MKHALIAAAVALAAPAAAFAENVWTYYAKDAADNPTNQGHDGALTNVACVANGGWVVAVHAYDSAKTPNEITLGAIGAAADDGVLDLRGMSVSKDGTCCAITSLGLRSATGFGAVTEFYSDSIASMAGGQFSGSTALTKVGLSGDRFTAVPSGAFKNCTSLTNLVMACPNLKTYQTECLLNISPTNDVTEIISANTQGNGWGQYKELQVAASAMIYGSLSLTNVANAHHLLSFSSMNCVTNFYFTGPFTGAMGSGDGMVKGHGKVRKLTYWFENVTEMNFSIGDCSSIEDIVLYAPALTNVAEGVFGREGTSSAWEPSWSRSLKRLWVYGPALGTNVVDRLVGAFSVFAPDEVSGAPNYYPSDTSRIGKDVFERGILYCSKKQGWKDLASPLTAGTYEATNAPEGCFGMYVTASGKRKAWMVHLPQDTDPRTGAVIVVR